MTNRVPARHLANEGKCGACRGVLPAQREPLEVWRMRKLDRLLQQVRVPVVVELQAESSSARLAATAASLAGRALVVRVSPSLAYELSLRHNLEDDSKVLWFFRGELERQRNELVDPSVLESWAIASA